MSAESSPTVQLKHDDNTEVKPEGGVLHDVKAVDVSSDETVAPAGFPVEDAQDSSVVVEEPSDNTVTDGTDHATHTLLDPEQSLRHYQGDTSTEELAVEHETREDTSIAKVIDHTSDEYKEVAPEVPPKEEEKTVHHPGIPEPEQQALDERTAIQNEAIQHLAHRASSMNLEPVTQAPTAVHRDAKLPAAPPPPPVPEKLAPEVPDKEPALAVAKSTPAMEDSDARDVPEAPHGPPEQAGEEIQHIIDQFQLGGSALGEEEIMSPRLEKQQPILQLPPRTSSLDAKTPNETGRDHYFAGKSMSSRDSFVSINTQPATAADETSSITSHRTSIFQPPPPSPDPEPALPFDFHRFLEQLRHRTADPVARFLRSFLQEFGKKQWMVHEQVKIIGDFLEFIAKKMAQCEIWRTVSDAEFDNAREGMEKLVMNRLYTQTFSPAIPPFSGSPRKGKSVRAAAEVAGQTGSGRKGQHQEDVERDEVIAQKMRIYGWIKEEHLDIKPIGDKGKKFLSMAEQELLKLNTYRAPRDKVICVLNCCKVIFGFLKNSKGDQGADSFVPLLIYTVLRARPEHLVSNVQYIWRFRNQDKLGGEAGYYMSSLMGVVTFLENLDRTMITISDEDFEKNVEQAVSAIAEGHQSGEYESKAHDLAGSSSSSVPSMQHLTEKAAISRPEVTARNSVEVERSSPRRDRTARQSTRPSASDDDDTDAVTGLLRTIQKPLSSIGRIFSDDGPTQRSQQDLRPGSTPLPPRTSSRTLSPAARVDRSSSQGRWTADDGRQAQQAQEAAVRQASVETAEHQRERQRGFAIVVETLQGMFPNLDKEILEDVVRAQEGNVQRAVDACLSLSGQA